MVRKRTGTTVYLEWKDKGKSFLDYVSEGFEENKDKFINTAVKMGMDTSKGLANGLDAAAYMVERSAENLADIIKRAIMDALGMHSPSRVGIDLGLNFGKSISIGMDNAEKIVKTAARKLGLASVPETPARKAATASGAKSSGEISISHTTNIYAKPDGNMLYQLDLQAKRDGMRTALLIAANGGATA